MVKLQFRKQKRRYKRKTYEYERISLHFPRETNQTLQSLWNKQLRLKVTEKDGAYNVSLTDTENT